MNNNLPILKTQRLTLRPQELSDGHRLNMLIDKDERVWKFNPGREKTIEERKEAILHRIGQYKTFGFGCYGVVLNDENELIGQCGLSPYWYEHRNGRSTLEFEVMYHFGHEYWGKGFATEAAKRWVDFAFEEAKLPRLVVCPDKNNKASIAVLQRLGFSIQPDWLEPDTVICALHHKEDGEEVLNLY